MKKRGGNHIFVVIKREVIISLVIKRGGNHIFCSDTKSNHISVIKRESLGFFYDKLGQLYFSDKI